MVMEFLAYLTESLERLKNKIELLNSIWTFIGECPEWLNYHNHLDENVQTLEKKMESLCSVEEDLNTQLENAEFQPGNKRKREVENWLRNVQSKKSDVQKIDQNVREMNFLYRAWLGSHVERNIREVEELFEQGRFSEGPVLTVPQSRGEALLTTALVGDVTPERNLKKVWDYLMNDEVLRIGVLGKGGIGKTSIMMHIHNRLVKNTTSNNFDHVYWVTVSQEFSIHELQNVIAKEVGLDHLDEKDERKRAAKLYNALRRRKKSVLILDGLWNHFPLHNVGIRTEVNGCKLIFTTQSSEVCRKMGCQEIIKVEPLLFEEAERLFMKKLGLNSPLAPEVEEYAKLIVKECDGLPQAIINAAETLRGVDDVNEWRNTLTEVRGF